MQEGERIGLSTKIMRAIPIEVLDDAELLHLQRSITERFRGRKLKGIARHSLRAMNVELGRRGIKTESATQKKAMARLNQFLAEPD
jgi:hypothetical protein